MKLRVSDGNLHMGVITLLPIKADFSAFVGSLKVVRWNWYTGCYKAPVFEIRLWHCCNNKAASAHLFSILCQDNVDISHSLTAKICLGILLLWEKKKGYYNIITFFISTHTVDACYVIENIIPYKNTFILNNFKMAICSQ